MWMDCECANDSSQLRAWRAQPGLILIPFHPGRKFFTSHGQLFDLTPQRARRARPQCFDCLMLRSVRCKGLISPDGRSMHCKHRSFDCLHHNNETTTFDFIVSRFSRRHLDYHFDFFLLLSTTSALPMRRAPVRSTRRCRTVAGRRDPVDRGQDRSPPNTLRRRSR